MKGCLTISFRLLVVVIGFLVISNPESARAVIYEVPRNDDEVVGAWDVNILADDVEFPVASVIREIRMPLAIAGEQQCTLWIFDGMSNPPIHTVAFTNAPAVSEFDLTMYVFEMSVQVPKRIWVGFSAQGDGWGGGGVDYWSRDFEVTHGVSGTPGRYYFGPVANGELTSVFDAGDASFGSLTIVSEPVRFSGIHLQTGCVHLAIGSLPIYATNVLERGEFAAAGDWQELETLPLGTSGHTWHGVFSNDFPEIFRIRSR